MLTPFCVGALAPSGLLGVFLPLSGTPPSPPGVLGVLAVFASLGVFGALGVLAPSLAGVLAPLGVFSALKTATGSFVGNASFLAAEHGFQVLNDNGSIYLNN